MAAVTHILGAVEKAGAGQGPVRSIQSRTVWISGKGDGPANNGSFAGPEQRPGPRKEIPSRMVGAAAARDVYRGMRRGRL